MASSFSNKPDLNKYYLTATGPRTRPLTVARPAEEWRVNMGLVTAESRDADSVIFIPQCRYWTDDEDATDDPKAEWRDEPEPQCCFKTSYMYQVMAQGHPRFVPVIGQDEWTGLPILAKPSLGTLGEFIHENLSRLYGNSSDGTGPRLRAEFLPLAYQWSLQLLSALALCHSHNVAYGEVTESCCWLSSSSLSLSLAGFLGSKLQDIDPIGDLDLDGWFYSGIRFSPNELTSEKASEEPTLRTDMFIFGRIVYQIMTSHEPGHGVGWNELLQMMMDENWPELEDRYMGKIVHKCWSFEYENIEELTNAVKAFIRSQGWDINGQDELEGLDIDSITRQLRVGDDGA